MKPCTCNDIYGHAIQVMIFLYAAPWAHGAILASSLATFIVSYMDPSDECNIYDNPSHACYTSYYTSLAVFTLYGGFMVTLDIGRQVQTAVLAVHLSQCTHFAVALARQPTLVHCIQRVLEVLEDFMMPLLAVILTGAIPGVPDSVSRPRADHCVRDARHQAACRLGHHS